MEVVFECPKDKKKELLKVLEKDPYAEDSFARVGYKLKDGEIIKEDPHKLYLYLSADEGFIEKAKERLKDITNRCPEDVEKRIIGKIKEEEDSAVAGMGSLFG